MNGVPYYYENMPIGYQAPALGGGSDYSFALSRYGSMAGQVDASSMPSFNADTQINDVWDRRINGLFPSQTQDPKTGAVMRDGGTLAPALGAAQGIFNAWMGMKQYGLAKDALASSKQQFNLNYDAQRTTTNAQLRDRQAARVASNPGAYQSVGEYMTANSIGPR